MPPVVIAAGIGAAAGIGGGLLSASATKKAANKAADTSLQTSQMNNALTEKIYQSNTANMQPFMQNGLRASNALTGMLLGPTAGTPVAGQPAPQMGGTPVNALARQGLTPDDIVYRNGRFTTKAGQPLAQNVVQQIYAGQQQGGVPQAAPMQTAAPAPAGTVAATVNPWDQFRNSTNYQFRFDEGQKSLGHSMLGNLESGEAGKAFIRYGQNFASNEINPYLNLLANQQSMGMAGASALAGVGQNMVNNVTANNNSAGTAAANAALMAGNANANMYGGIANSLGNLAGSVSSYYSTPKQYR